MGGNVNYIYKPRTERKSIDRQLGSATTDPNSSITIANLQDMVKNLQGFSFCMHKANLLCLIMADERPQNVCYLQVWSLSSHFSLFWSVSWWSCGCLGVVFGLPRGDVICWRVCIPIDQLTNSRETLWLLHSFFESFTQFQSLFSCLVCFEDCLRSDKKIYVKKLELEGTKIMLWFVIAYIIVQG